MTVNENHYRVQRYRALARQRAERFDLAIQHLRDLIALATAFNQPDDVNRLTAELERFYHSDVAVIVQSVALTEHECAPRTTDGPDHCGLCGSELPEDSDE